MTDFRMSSRVFDAPTVDVMERTFAGENLVQVILHSHLLVERALASLVAAKCLRPDVMLGPEGRWSFSALTTLFTALYNPNAETIQCLRGLNRLRNMVAHQMHFDEQQVRAHLPWGSETLVDPPNALEHVKAVAGVLLVFRLGAVNSVQCLDAGVQTPDLDTGSGS